MLSALTCHESIYSRDSIVDSKLASSLSLAKRISELASYVHFYSATRCLTKMPPTLPRAMLSFPVALLFLLGAVASQMTTSKYSDRLSPWVLIPQIIIVIVNPKRLLWSFDTLNITLQLGSTFVPFYSRLEPLKRGGQIVVSYKTIIPSIIVNRGLRTHSF